MTIENPKYVQVNGQNTGIVVTIDGQYSSVPLDPGNRHYEEILEWVETEGNTIESADVPPDPTYQENRVKEYPQIGDQLDALYHAGVFPAAMTASIKAIKDKYPKE
jgi:hypothetical protein